jgi:uncharacterized membrane protein
VPPVILKFIHITAIAIWSAGLICLPLLYRQRRALEGNPLHRLHNFTRFFYVAVISPAAFVSIASGTALIFVQQTFTPWFSVKLAFVGAMVLIHVMSGLQILRLFEPGKTYPMIRLVIIFTLTLAIVSTILAVVLGKPDFGRSEYLEAWLEPRALGTFAGDLIPWLR